MGQEYLVGFNSLGLSALATFLVIFVLSFVRRGDDGMSWDIEGPMAVLSMIGFAVAITVIMAAFDGLWRAVVMTGVKVVGG